MELSNSSIIICGIVRNAANNLRVNIPEINAISSQFQSFKIVVFENNSTDDTKLVLTKWAESDPDNIIISMADFDASPTIPVKSSFNRYYCYQRIDRMVKLRNQYMDFIAEHNLTADYLMVVDLDVEHIYHENILKSFSADIEWDAICAFGYGINSRFRRCYYDTYALTLWEDKDRSQTERTIYVDNHCLDILKSGDAWVRVASAFGGLVIYKFDAVKGLRYSTIPNADARVEVHCEHYSLFRQMIERGYDRIFVVPSMRLKYQALSWRLIRKHVRQIFCR